MSDQPLSWTPPPPRGYAAAKAMADAVTRNGTPRLAMIDLLRGLVIVLMVLDHTREYFSAQALMFEPTDLTRTSAALFATRWVTHLCAPTFVFLAGVSAYLQRQGGPDRGAVARYLLTRGLWLIVLEATLITFAFNFAHPFLFLQVIWAIGAGMILLAGLLWVPPWVVLALGCVIVGGHGLLVGSQTQGLGPLWQLLMQPGPLSWAPGIEVYPIIPWFGIMCLGYGLGHVFTLQDVQRRWVLQRLAAAALLLFLVIRALNQYGDPAPWAHQKDALFTMLSFLDVAKYPPSLDYVLVTLGVSLLIGLWLETWKGVFSRPLLVFGRTPLFTYLLHIFLIHGLALLVGMARGLAPADFTHFLTPEASAKLAAEHWGFGLPLVLLIWLLIVAAFYPLSRAYLRLKQTKRAAWMSYL